jgi:hypothetical protein
MTDITLNCLIVPVGDFNNVQCNAIHQMITIRTSQPVSILINAIKDRLGLNIELSIYQIHPRSIQEKKMEPQELISKFFGQQPQAEFFHVTVYSR